MIMVMKGEDVHFIRSSSILSPGRRWSMMAHRVFIIHLMIPLLLIPLIMFVGDAITTWRPGGAHNLYWSLWDPLLHAILALLVVSPLIIRKYTHQIRKAMVITGLVAVLLDLDHVIATGSFSLRVITNMPVRRPNSHSLLFAAGCGLLAYILTRREANGWLIFGALASHILRDATSGTTPFLWPLPVYRLSIPASYVLQITLFLLTVTLAKLCNPRE